MELLLKLRVYAAITVVFVDNYSKVITTYISEHCYLLVITTLAVKYLEDTNILMYSTNLHFYAKQVFWLWIMLSFLEFDFKWSIHYY